MKSKIIVSCSVKGTMYQGKRTIELYIGDDQKTIDANKGLVRRVEKEMREILYSKYLPVVEAREKKELDTKKAILEVLEKDGKSYYEVERWVYGQCEGVVKQFQKDELSQLKLWLEDNVESNCALIVSLTNDITSAVIDNIWL